MSVYRKNKERAKTRINKERAKTRIGQDFHKQNLILLMKSKGRNTFFTSFKCIFDYFDRNDLFYVACVNYGRDSEAFNSLAKEAGLNKADL